MNNMKYIKCYRTKGLWWFRIYGYGIHYKNTRYHAELFSERVGYRKKLKLREHSFEILKPEIIRHAVNDARHTGKMEERKQYYTINPRWASKRKEK